MPTLRELPGLSEEMGLVDRYLWQYLTPERESGRVGEILQEVMASAGKRHRPRLVLLAGRLGPDYPNSRDRLCRVGALLEMVHMASLIHDDIVDDSPLRRGRPTVQSRFGKDLAVYAGDLLLGRLLDLVLSQKLDGSGALIAASIQDMCRGEIGQFDCRYRTDTGLSEYLRHIYGKTASLFVTACRAGGLESGCEAGQLDLLAQVGKHLGYLFQIRDDLLDFVSDETREGKPIHMDFREGIFTLPVLCTLSHPQYGPPLQALANRAAAGLLSADDLDEMDRLVRRSGGLQEAARAMAAHARDGAAKLAELPQGAATEAIEELFALLTLPLI